MREKTFYDIQILLFFSIVSENFFFHDLVSCVQLKVFNDKWQWWKSGKNEKLVKKYPFHQPVRRQHSDIRWNYLVTLPRYFSFPLPHLNINTVPPSDELDKNIQRKSHFLLFSHWNGYNHFRFPLDFSYAFGIL